jgi:hypothetical protein
VRFPLAGAPRRAARTRTVLASACHKWHKTRRAPLARRPLESLSARPQGRVQAPFRLNSPLFVTPYVVVRGLGRKRHVLARAMRRHWSFWGGGPHHDTAAVRRRHGPEPPAAERHTWRALLGEAATCALTPKAMPTPLYAIGLASARYPASARCLGQPPALGAGSTLLATQGISEKSPRLPGQSGFCRRGPLASWSWS